MEFSIDCPWKRPKTRCKGNQVKAERQQNRGWAEAFYRNEGDGGGGKGQGDKQEGGDEKCPSLPDRHKLEPDEGEDEVDGLEQGRDLVYQMFYDGDGRVKDLILICGVGVV